MHKSLFKKYFTICASIIFVSVIFLGIMLLIFSMRYFNIQTRQELSEALASASTYTKQQVEEDGRTDLSYAGAISVATGTDIFLVGSNNGEVIYCTESLDGGVCTHSTYSIDESIINAALEGNFFETGTLGNIYTNPHFTIGASLEIGAVGYGELVLFVSTPTSGMGIFLRDIFMMFVISAIAVLVLAFIVIYFATFNMVKPLRQMSVAVKCFSQGDFSIRIPVDGNDELSQLSMAFNNMATSLAELEQSRRSFTANISHELKTPMTVIGGFVDGMLDNTIPKEKHQHYLKIVSDETKRLSRLVRSMLELARIEAGEMSLTMNPVDITSVITGAVFNFERIIEEKNIDIRGLDIGKIYVNADVDLIHQVVYNLIDNAVKFTPDGGYILFSVNVSGNIVSIGVRNSGSGISKEDMIHIFERFYKSDRSRSINKNGVGLGLYIVRSIINLHGGDILVNSKEGEYSEFVFTLSVAKGK